MFPIFIDPRGTVLGKQVTLAKFSWSYSRTVTGVSDKPTSL